MSWLRLLYDLFDLFRKGTVLEEWEEDLILFYVDLGFYPCCLGASY